jgi:hypothetical protein
MIGSLVGTRLLIYLNDDRCVDGVGPLGRHADGAVLPKMKGRWGSGFYENGLQPITC